MQLFFALGAALALAAGSASGFDVGVRAPARLTIEDCLCQCDSQLFVDDYGRKNGNCKTSDNTGKRWCYLKDVDDLIRQYRNNGHSSWNRWNTVKAPSPVSTTCPDARSSSKFNNKVFGYHACGTPELSDYRCQELLYGGGGGGGGGGHYPTQRPTYRPPTHRPTYRPTYRPTHRPTYRPPYTTTRRPWWRGSKDSTKLTDVVGIRYYKKAKKCRRRWSRCRTRSQKY